MRLSLALLGLLATGCSAGGTLPEDGGSAPAEASARAEPYGPDGAPWSGPRADAPSPAEPSSSEPAPAPRAERQPPTPPPHVDELFRTPGNAAAPSPDPVAPPPIAAPQQTTKPAPPPSPPPRPRPRPWGGGDPCPPCGMG